MVTEHRANAERHAATGAILLRSDAHRSARNDRDEVVRPQ